MLPPSFDGESNHGTWNDLENGAPTVSGFARLCSNRISSPPNTEVSVDKLSIEAQAILFAARELGVIELRGNKNAFSPVDRFLAVCVPVSDDCRLVFKQKSNPRQSIAFLDGFRQLCAAGLVMHHLQIDFSLTSSGFELAGAIAENSVGDAIKFANEELL